MTENNELENIEIPEPEIIPNPWDNAPTDVYFYEKIYEDGHLGSFTQSAELAYKSGWDIENNYIPISDTQQSDINGRSTQGSISLRDYSVKESII